MLDSQLRINAVSGTKPWQDDKQEALMVDTDSNPSSSASSRGASPEPELPETGAAPTSTAAVTAPAESSGAPTAPAEPTRADDPMERPLQAATAWTTSDVMAHHGGCHFGTAGRRRSREKL